MKIAYDLIYSATASLLPVKMASIESKALLLAIGLQESAFEHRRQMNDGPARSWWQFEQGGAVRGVLQHAATRPYILPIIEQFGYEDYPATCWTAIEHNDIVACAFARLLLWTVPSKLPKPEQHEVAWRQYLWAWRPGKPHADKWPGNYALAWQMVR
jgi:hypothetical protein